MDITKLNNRPIRLLIGGSPCTHWSIAQKNNRETKPEGLGWELFKNYLIAKEKFQPDYFLYENNQSASQEIKNQISKELGVELQYINSNLVSAQNRKRFYAHNIPNVEQPKDRKIFLSDILDHTATKSNTTYEFMNLSKSFCVALRGRYNSDKTITQKYEPRFDKKTNTITTVQKDNFICTPIRMGNVGSNSQGDRVYTYNGKSITISANGGGKGAKTGLYFVPILSKKENIQNIYEVKNGIIFCKENYYKINLPDGFYCIRKLTPVECERLQTLPDNYTEGISNAQRYKCIGNGWTAEVIIHILSYMNIPKDYPIEVLSLYDGIATGRYCLEKLGYKNIIYKAYEIDKYAIQIANKNYPDIIQCGNAFQIRENNWEY